MIPMIPSWSRALAALAFAAASSDAALVVRLTLPDGSPAAGYSLSVVDRALSVPCDGEGLCRFDPAPELPASVVASAPDGAASPPLEILELPADGVVSLALPDRLRDIVTVVSGVAPTLDLLPGSAPTVLTVEALEQRPPQRLFQALESVAGASKLGEGADSVPAIRGLGRGRTLILIDGARVTAERRAGPSATFLDPSSLAAIEVLRGPGSVAYGSDAFGGVINAVTADPTPGRFSLRWSAESSSGGIEQVGGSVAVSADVLGGSLLVEGHTVDSDDGEAGGGEEIFNSGFESSGGGLRYVRYLGTGKLRASVLVDRMDDLGKAAIDSSSIRAFYPLEDSDRFQLAWTGALGGGWESLDAAIFYDDYHVVLDRDRAPTASSNRRIDRADTDARDASLRGVVARPWAGGRLQLGGQAVSRFDLRAISSRVNYDVDATTVTSTSTTVSVEDAEQTALGLFATWTRPLAARWTLGVGVRGDRIDTENRGGFFGDRSESADALSGSLSLTAQPTPEWTATAQLARGFRVPTLSDRYFRGASGRGFVIGNPDLDPETSLQWDLAVRYGKPKVAVGVSLYRYAIDDLIERYQEGDNFLFRNRGKGVVEGFDVEAQARFADGWTGDLGLAWTESRADGEAIDDASAPNGWIGTRWTAGKGYVYGRVTAFLEKDDPGPTELERDGFTLVDIGGGFTVVRWLELRLAVRNLFDEEYFGAPDNAADRSPGRTLTIGLTGRI